jgi:hypothetical protein
MLPVDRREHSDLDSTQTVRAVTTEELFDSHRPRWYAIQLVVSERAMNLDTMPRLEIFATHRLYAVVGKQNNASLHALRLGFFPDEESAEATREYLRSFFSTPSIVRVSAAEHARFLQSSTPRAAPAPKPAPPSAPAPRPSVAPVAAPPRATVPAVSRKAAAEKSGTARNRPKTLAEELLDEAREVQLSRSGKHRVPQQKPSWIARIFGAAKR